MLQVRAYVPRDSAASTAGVLRELVGVSHVTRGGDTEDGEQLVTADVNPEGSGGLAGLTTTDPSTIVIALAAGVAGMLAVETRAGAAVGVAISVTTIPAAAYLGVAVHSSQSGDALGALGVLGTDLPCVLFAGTLTLMAQRSVRGIRLRPPERA